MKIKLSNKPEFKLIPEGRNVLKITEAKAVPSGKPQAIEVKFEAENGGKCQSIYNFNNEKGMFVLSLIIRNVFGDCDEFETSRASELEGKFLEVEIKHTQKPSSTEEGKILTFVNIGKIIGSGEPFGEVTEPDFSTTIDIEDEDLPF